MSMVAHGGDSVGAILTCSEIRSHRGQRMFKFAPIFMLLACLASANLMLVGCRTDSDKTPVSSMTIAPTVLAGATQGLPYSQTLTVTGAVGTPLWSLAATSDALPSGLTLDPVSGVLSGTPGVGTQGGYSIIVRVDDGFGVAQRTYGLAIGAPVLAMLNLALPDATEGVAYNTTLVAAGGSGGPYAFSIDPNSEDSLPPSLQLVGATGAINGTPDQLSSGTYTISFTVSDGTLSAIRVLTIRVIRPELNFSTAALPYAVVGLNYETTLKASGGTYNYAWGIAPASQSQLPGGISLNAQTGIISGNAPVDQVGDYDITFTVFDGEKTNLKTLLLRVVPLPVTLTPGALPNGVEGAAYSQSFAAIGGSGVYTYSIAPLPAQQLPAGLSLNSDTGEVSGTLEFDTARTYSLLVTADDGQATSTATMTLTIDELDPATLLPALVTGRGGMAGGAIASGAPLIVKAIDSRTGLGISGIGVVRGTSVGSVTVSSVTDATGQAVLVGSDIPQSVTFVDSVTGFVKSFLGSPQAPLREAIVAAMPRGPRFTVNVTGIPASSDLVVTLNGREVFAVDAANVAGENVTVTWESDEDMIVGAGEPWLLLAHAYSNQTGGEVDRAGTMTNVAWLRDSDGGTTVDGIGAFTLNIANGVGTSGNGMTTGTAPVLTLSGQITRPALSAGAGATARVTAFLENSFGVHTYAYFVATPTDPFLLLPPLGPVYDYALTVPDFTAVPSAAVSDHVRLVELTIANVPDTLAALTTVGIGAVLTSRDAAPGPVAGGNIDLSLLVPSLQFVTAHVALGLDSVAGVGVASVTAELSGMISNDIWVTGTAQSNGSNQLAFPFLAGFPGTPITFSETYLGLGTGNTNGVTWSTGASIQTVVPRAATVTLSGDGNTGSLGNGVESMIRLSETPLSLGVSAPIGGTSFSLSGGQFGWLGTGLDERDGLYQIRLEIPDGAGTREWIMEVPADATQVPSIASYLFNLPKLPLGLPFSVGAMTSAMNAVGVSISYIDTTDTGINLLQRRMTDFAYPQYDAQARRLSPSARASAFSPLWDVSLDAIADIDPVP